MELHLYLEFVLATTVLVLIPGPNASLIVANSLAHGTRYGLLTVAGTSLALLPQLALVAAGLTAALGSLAAWFEWVRWIGVAYLLYLGFRQWFAPPADTASPAPARLAWRAAFRGFLVSLTNPKTLLFYGAFFPQFLSIRNPVGPQLAWLCCTFLALLVVLDCCWAVLAGRLRGLVATKGRFRNRLSGAFLITAGAGLALAHRQ
jgi:threonine/homoserine/homoserine lactone efflux protein